MDEVEEMKQHKLRIWIITIIIVLLLDLFMLLRDWSAGKSAYAIGQITIDYMIGGDGEGELGGKLTEIAVGRYR